MVNCKICGIVLGNHNKSELCQKHLRQKKAKEYYQNRRLNHKCLKCNCDIEPTAQGRYHKLCDEHRIEERKLWANMSPEQKKERLAYQRQYEKQSPKYKAYIQNPANREKQKKYMETYNLKRHKEKGEQNNQNDKQ